MVDKSLFFRLPDKSEFGWKTVEEYTKHELADDDKDEKKIRQAKCQMSMQTAPGLWKSGSFHRNPIPNQPREFTSKSGNCFACGKFGH
jgi:hypothetical protein